MIIKVQISQFTTTAEKQVLVYNESRTILGEFPLTVEIEEAMQGRIKAFFKAEVSPLGAIELDRMVKDREW